MSAEGTSVNEVELENMSSPLMTQSVEGENHNSTPDTDIEMPARQNPMPLTSQQRSWLERSWLGNSTWRNSLWERVTNYIPSRQTRIRIATIGACTAAEVVGFVLFFDAIINKHQNFSNLTCQGDNGVTNWSCWTARTELASGVAFFFGTVALETKIIASFWQHL